MSLVGDRWPLRPQPFNEDAAEHPRVRWVDAFAGQEPSHEELVGHLFGDAEDVCRSLEGHEVGQVSVLGRVGHVEQVTGPVIGRSDAWAGQTVESGVHQLSKVDDRLPLSLHWKSIRRPPRGGAYVNPRDASMHIRRGLNTAPDHPGRNQR